MAAPQDGQSSAAFRRSPATENDDAAIVYDLSRKDRFIFSFGKIFSVQRMFRLPIFDSSTVNTLCQRSKLLFTRAPHAVNRSLVGLTTQDDHVPEM